MLSAERAAAGGCSPTATMKAMDSASPSQARPAMDEESRAWLSDLRSEGRRREEAIARLHQLLLGAARFEVNRRRAAMPICAAMTSTTSPIRPPSDALMAVLAKLDDFRGDSRFTTWAYKFALLEAAVKLRRRAWQGRELPVDPEQWSAIADSGSSRRPTRAARAARSDPGGDQERALAPPTRGAAGDRGQRRPDRRHGRATQHHPGALYKTVHDAARSSAPVSRTPGWDRNPEGGEANDDLTRAGEAVVSRLLGPAGPELSCERCFQELDRYVELVVAGEDAEARDRRDAGPPGGLPRLRGGLREPQGPRHRRRAVRRVRLRGDA